MGTRYGSKCKCGMQSTPSVYVLDAEVDARQHHRITGHKPYVWIVRNGRWAQRASSQPMYTMVYTDH